MICGRLRWFVVVCGGLRFDLEHIMFEHRIKHESLKTYFQCGPW